jgi:hypothetical protein
MVDNCSVSMQGVERSSSTLPPPSIGFVERAKSLLLRGNLSIAEVAQKVGFFDQSHFTRYFKRIIGVTPQALLQQDGLTYDGLIQAITGHVVGATTIVGTFRRVPEGPAAN